MKQNGSSEMEIRVMLFSRKEESQEKLLRVIDLHYFYDCSREKGVFKYLSDKLWEKWNGPGKKSV